MPKDIELLYEGEQIKLSKSVQKKITAWYEACIDKVLAGQSITLGKRNIFYINDFPALNNRINKQLKALYENVVIEMLTGIDQAWNLSNSKTDKIVNIKLKGKTPSERRQQLLFDNNADALQQFKARKIKGLNLSERVWTQVKDYRRELESAIGVGVHEGKSAQAIAASTKKYLQEPDKLFRKVRDAEGNLQLSRQAKAYNPGQGVYRSSHANAMRVARTETNMAYRSADHARWKQIPFITGFTVKLSNNHPTFDICDHLQGDYPVDFKFAGWHPQCRCYAVSKMMSDAEYDKYEDYILGISDDYDLSKVKRVTNVPAAMTKYIEQNKDRIEAWQSKPYWMKDNKGFV